MPGRTPGTSPVCPPTRPSPENFLPQPQVTEIGRTESTPEVTCPEGCGGPAPTWITAEHLGHFARLPARSVGCLELASATLTFNADGHGLYLGNGRWNEAVDTQFLFTAVQAVPVLVVAPTVSVRSIAVRR